MQSIILLRDFSELVIDFSVTNQWKLLTNLFSNEFISVTMNLVTIALLIRYEFYN